MFRIQRFRLAVPPPAGIFYMPPGNQQDFNDELSYRQWENTVKENYTNAIWAPVDPTDPTATYPTGIAYRLPDARALANGTYANFGKSYLQYRATHDLVAMAQKVGKTTADAKISWTGFPKSLQHLGPLKYETAEKLGYTQGGVNYPLARAQDEYCEWFSKRTLHGKLGSVTITAESPEYWQFLFEKEPSTCLDLYRQYISPAVQLADLIDAQGHYDMYNKWNTTFGAMHLNCPPNSLFAEVYIAAEAATMWGTNGAPKTDPQDIIACAEYGRATRASDPHIGGEVNNLIRSGAVVSIERPVGLYLDTMKTTGWKDFNKKLFTPEQISQIVTYERGHNGCNLRIKVEIPASWGYTLGDCYIGGQNIAWAGQIVESASTIFLTGLALGGGDYVQPDAAQKAVVPCKALWNATSNPPVGPPFVTSPWYPPQARVLSAKRRA